jgi:predicted TIM-barrel fold metal-dependent hydrolase
MEERRGNVRLQDLTPKTWAFAKEHGAVGVCVRPFERGKVMTDPFYYPIYDEAERLDIPVTVHMDERRST